MNRKIEEEINQAYEQERLTWMRRRFLAFCIFSAVVSAAGLFIHPWLYGVLPDLLNVALFVAGYVFVRRRAQRPADIVRLAFWLIFSAGVVTFLIAPWLRNALPVMAAKLRHPFEVFVPVAAIHFLACLFLPWTLREAAKVLGVLSALGVAATLLYASGSWPSFLTLLFLPLAGVPGLAVCWFRHSRFYRRVALKHLTGRYGDLRGELEHARAIHEMLFPTRIEKGPIRLAYQYEPMLDIGGDYLYARSHPDGRLSVLVIDVNGHGIGAALTVNRVYGEFERLYGENEYLAPHEVLAAVNHYFAVSLAREGIFATAICVRVDPATDTVEWANAGHPPALMVRKAGTLDLLESHALMLGVLDGEAYQCRPQQATWVAGDRLILYTDGVTEARDQKGLALEVEGFCDMVQQGRIQGPGVPMAPRLLQAVQAYRSGPAADDTLIVEVLRVS
jgi:hypothetical protein